MKRLVWVRKGLMALAAAAMFAAPAAAQYRTEGSQFLKAVEDRDGNAATKLLEEPGTTVVNARDITTGRTAMHIVVERRDTTWIAFLRQRGADPDLADKKGVTPLQIASNLGFIEGVEALLKAGARVDQNNAAGETPLIAAVHRRDIAMVRMLLANGADPDRNDNSGRSARDYAELINGGKQFMDAFAQADADRKGGGKRQTYGPSFRP